MQIVPDRLDRLVDRYNRFKPKILYGYPSSIHNLVGFAAANGKSLHQPRLIVTHAENLYTEIRETLEKTFPDAGVVNQYWSSEANIGVTCPHGRMHIDEDTTLCEVINPDSTGIGDLLVTNLYSYDFPIIRYDIGDRVRLSNTPCTCGRNTHILDFIEGRAIEHFTLPDGRKIPYTALYFSQFGENMLSYQVIYHKKEALWELVYIPMDPSAPIQEEDIRKHVREEYGLPVKFTRTDRVIYSKSGKVNKMIIRED